MAEGGIHLDELNRDNPYDDVDNIQELEKIFNDSSYDTVGIDEILAAGALQSGRPPTTLEEIKVKMTHENMYKLKTLVTTKYPHVGPDLPPAESTNLNKRIFSKKGELYLRTKGPRVAIISIGSHKYKAIKITRNKGKDLLELATLKSYGMSTQDEYYKILSGDRSSKTEQETSFGQVAQSDQAIEGVETLRKTVADVHDDFTRQAPLTSTPRARTIEEIPRQLEQSRELGNVITDEDRQMATKYLDFVKQNYDKKIQLINDIERNKKLLADAERKLRTEIEENKIDDLRKVISDSEANIQTSKQMLDQILAYNERQYEDINMRLKSKFTLREKLGNIFRKYGLTITAITLALGLVIDTIVSRVSGGSPGGASPSGSNITNKIKQSLKNFSNWLLEMGKKAVDNLPAIIGSIVSFLLKVTASVVGFLAEHLILFAIALAFALYEAIQIGYQDIKRRR